MAYSSITSMNNMITSQRDDLVSLVYMMLHLHRGNLKFYGLDFKDNPSFQDFKNAKQQATPESLCGQDFPFLMPFIKEISKLEHGQKPNYTSLQFHLSKCIMWDIEELDWVIKKP